MRSECPEYPNPRTVAQQLEMTPAPPIEDRDREDAIVAAVQHWTPWNRPYNPEALREYPIRSVMNSQEYARLMTTMTMTIPPDMVATIRAAIRDAAAVEEEI